MVVELACARMYKYRHVSTGVTYTIDQDEFALDPRKEYDNVGTMVCWHRKYNLGDMQPKCSPSDYMLSVLDGIGVKCKEGTNLLCALERHATVLPLYLYDHSGITMATTPFRCPWDSGRVGFIYVLNQIAEIEWPGRGRNKSALAYLQSEVETYNAYISDNCYAWESSDGDACGGYYYHTSSKWTDFVSDMLDIPAAELEEINDD
jgi:hypothetical protein